jgi:hypothetical protein
VTAGSWKKKGQKKMGTRMMMRERGKRKRYAPSTPAIAPEAPTVGTVESPLVNQCVSPAMTPVRR